MLEGSSPVHWQFPAAAKFGRVIPKEKLYSQVGANAELKQLFVEQVSQIKWAYKLAENTINLAKTKQVLELEIIQIKLKAQTIDEKVLAAIDKAIPHPTVFMLMRGSKSKKGSDGEHIENEQEVTEIAYQAAHKSKLITQTNKEKWQRSQYLKSQWVAEANQLEAPLPAATNLEGLYHLLLEALMPKELQGNQKIRDSKGRYSGGSSAEKDENQERAKPRTDKSLTSKNIEEKLATLAEIEAIKKQIEQVKNKRDKEKQFNRKRELNDQFKALNKQLSALKSE